MQKLFIAITALALALVAFAPSATADLVDATTNVGAVCVLVNTDGCTTTWATGALDAYAFSTAGAFTGTVTMTVASHADPTVVYTQSCSGVIVGALVANGGCTSTGRFPAGAIDVSCVSSGTGAIVCALAGN